MKLLNLTVRNFKGIASGDFSYDNINVIEAENQSGKTTQLSAYKWLLGFKQDFAPALKYENEGKIDYIIIGTPDKPMITEVSGIIEHNGLTYSLKRINTQKWKNGNLSGNVCKYYFDSQSEVAECVYCQNISGLFNIAHKELGLLLDIKSFNEDTSWQDRRSFLFEKLDIVSLVKEFADKEEYSLLSNDLKKGHDEIAIQKSLTAEKSSIKKAQEDNLTLIADREKQLAVYTLIDFKTAKAELTALQAEYESLLTASTRENKNTIISNLQEKIAALSTQLNAERARISQNEQSNNNLLFTAQRSLSVAENDLRIYNDKIKRLESEIEELKIDLDIAKDSTFDEHAKSCPTCQRELPADKITTLIADFESKKAKSITDISLKAEKCTLELQTARDKTNTLSNAIVEIKANIERIKAIVIDPSKEIELQKKIDKLQTEIAEVSTKVARSTTVDKIAEIKTKMSEVNLLLGKQAVVQDIEEAINKLRDDSIKLTKQDQQRILKQEQLTAYVEAKVNLVNAKVNENFNGGVSFKFFNYNMDGAENPWINTCTCLYNGKNYDTQTSTGAKILADIYVTKGLQKILGVNLPLWVDNSESMTMDIQTEQQLFDLRAVRGKKLDNILTVQKMYNIENDCILRSV